jgi:uncharacterized protein (TIGR03083 family)
MAETVADIREEIIAAHQALTRLLDCLSPADQERPTSNEGWTARDLIAHLATIGQRSRAQVESVFGGSKPATEDVNLFNERQVAERRSWSLDRVRAELESDHRAMLSLLDRLTDAGLDTPIDHPNPARRSPRLILSHAPVHVHQHGSEILAAARGKRLADLRSGVIEAYHDLIHVMADMDVERGQRPTSNEGWSAKDTIAHLSTINTRLRNQIACATSGSAYSAEGVDTFNEQQVAERRGWTIEQLRAELRKDNRDTLAALDTLTDADLDKTFQHPTRGPRSIEQSLAGVPGHFRTHTAEIAAATEMP